MADKRQRLLSLAQKYKLGGFAVKTVFNRSAVYRRSGGKVYFVSEDVSKISIRIKLTRKTMNYVGTIFGGSMFAATDPVYMFQLIALLGKDYIVWDKSSHIEFKKPGKSTLYFDLIVNEKLLNSIKDEVASNQKYIFKLPIELKTKDGLTVCLIEKEIYVASKEHYLQRKSIPKKTL